MMDGEVVRIDQDAVVEVLHAACKVGIRNPDGLPRETIAMAVLGIALAELAHSMGVDARSVANTVRELCRQAPQMLLLHIPHVREDGMMSTLPDTVDMMYGVQTRIREGAVDG